MPKKKLTLSIDEDILFKAKQAEINLSSFLEIRLTDFLLVKLLFAKFFLQLRIFGIIN
jgi:hypothetical protein